MTFVREKQVELFEVCEKASWFLSQEEPFQPTAPSPLTKSFNHIIQKRIESFLNKTSTYLPYKIDLLPYKDAAIVYTPHKTIYFVSIQSTKLFPKYLAKIAYQLIKLSNKGIQIDAIKIIKPNKKYIRKNRLALTKFLKIQDITKRAKKKIKDVTGYLDDIQQFKSTTPPLVKMNGQCKGCTYFSNCAPTNDNKSIFTLTQLPLKEKEAFYNNGILNIQQLPDTYKKTSKQNIQIKTLQNNSIFVNQCELKGFLNQITYPLGFLDFEAFQSVLPLFKKTKPFQSIPFQVSLHVQTSANSPIKHYEYLHTNNSDPRPALSKFLNQLQIEFGTVFAYNTELEKKVLSELCELNPRHKTHLLKIKNALTDFSKIYTNFMVYHPQFLGRFTLKDVYSAFYPKKSFDKLPISSGYEATQKYLSIWNNFEKEESLKVIDHLKKYSSLDTKALVDLLEAKRAMTVETTQKE